MIREKIFLVRGKLVSQFIPIDEHPASVAEQNPVERNFPEG